MSLCPHGIRIEHKRCYQCEDIAEQEMKRAAIEHDLKVLQGRGYTIIRTRTRRWKSTAKPNKSNPPK